jgi:hypothetical protein
LISSHLANLDTTLLRPDSASKKALPPTTKKNAKNKIQPLPVVPCKQFRTLANLMRESVVLTQACATLLRLLLLNYGHREWAFENCVLEEVAEIVLVCSTMPKILEYFMDMMHTMYAEGYILPVDLHAQYVSSFPFKICAPSPKVNVLVSKFKWM